MTRACFFVVALDYFGREQPTLYWDELPRTPIRRLTYVLRLDQQPNGERMVRTPLADLFTVYLLLKRRGKLPPKWEPPKAAKAAQATVRTGHREVHPRRYLPDAPAEIRRVRRNKPCLSG